MNIIKLNTYEFELESYSKTTYFNGNSGMNSTANFSISNVNMTTLNTVAQQEITLIEIKHDGQSIYTLEDTSAHVDTVTEYFGGDRMNINVNLTFTSST